MADKVNDVHPLQHSWLMPSSHFYVQSYGLLRFATVQVLRKTVGNRGVLGYV